MTMNNSSNNEKVTGNSEQVISNSEQVTGKREQVISNSEQVKMNNERGVNTSPFWGSFINDLQE